MLAVKSGGVMATRTTDATIATIDPGFTMCIGVMPPRALMVLIHSCHAGCREGMMRMGRDGEYDVCTNTSKK